MEVGFDRERFRDPLRSEAPSTKGSNYFDLVNSSDEEEVDASPLHQGNSNKENKAEPLTHSATMHNLGHGGAQRPQEGSVPHSRSTQHMRPIQGLRGPTFFRKSLNPFKSHKSHESHKSQGEYLTPGTGKQPKSRVGRPFAEKNGNGNAPSHGLVRSQTSEFTSPDKPTFTRSQTFSPNSPERDEQAHFFRPKNQSSTVDYLKPEKLQDAMSERDEATLGATSMDNDQETRQDQTPKPKGLVNNFLPRSPTFGISPFRPKDGTSLLPRSATFGVSPERKTISSLMPGRRASAVTASNNNNNNNTKKKSSFFSSSFRPSPAAPARPQHTNDPAGAATADTADTASHDMADTSVTGRKKEKETAGNSNKTTGITGGEDAALRRAQTYLARKKAEEKHRTPANINWGDASITWGTPPKQSDNDNSAAGRARQQQQQHQQQQQQQLPHSTSSRASQGPVPRETGNYRGSPPRGQRGSQSKREASNTASKSATPSKSTRLSPSRLAARLTPSKYTSRTSPARLPRETYISPSKYRSSPSITPNKNSRYQRGSPARQQTAGRSDSGTSSREITPVKRALLEQLDQRYQRRKSDSSAKKATPTKRQLDLDLATPPKRSSHRQQEKRQVAPAARGDRPDRPDWSGQDRVDHSGQDNSGGSLSFSIGGEEEGGRRGEASEVLTQEASSLDDTLSLSMELPASPPQVQQEGKAGNSSSNAGVAAAAHRNPEAMADEPAEELQDTDHSGPLEYRYPSTANPAATSRLQRQRDQLLRASAKDLVDSFDYKYAATSESPDVGATSPPPPPTTKVKKEKTGLAGFKSKLPRPVRALQKRPAQAAAKTSVTSSIAGLKTTVTRTNSTSTALSATSSTAASRLASSLQQKKKNSTARTLLTTLRRPYKDKTAPANTHETSEKKPRVRQSLYAFSSSKTSFSTNKPITTTTTTTTTIAAKQQQRAPASAAAGSSFAAAASSSSCSSSSSCARPTPPTSRAVLALARSDSTPLSTSSAIAPTTKAKSGKGRVSSAIGSHVERLAAARKQQQKLTQAQLQIANPALNRSRENDEGGQENISQLTRASMLGLRGFSDKKERLEKRRAQKALKQKHKHVQSGLKSLRKMHKELKEDVQAWTAEGTDWLAQCSVEFEKMRQKLAKRDNQTEEEKRENSLFMKHAVRLEEQLAEERWLRRQVEERHQESLESRRKLLMQMQRLKGNIRVLCRVRPKTRFSKESAVLADSLCNSVVAVNPKSKRNTKTEFGFHRVLGDASKQSEVFEEVIDCVTSVLDGYNACVFAYGQTGAGKTYTMEGQTQADGDFGVTFRSIDSIFKQMQARQEDFTFEVSVSAIEIYNETVRNLIPAQFLQPEDLNSSDENGKKKNSVMRETPSVRVASSEQTFSVLSAAMLNRCVGSTDLNKMSSRSHCVVTMRVLAENLLTGIAYDGKLHLVDLAGSENVARSQASGMTLHEAKNINRSLAALGDVFMALAKKGQHVPYRNSKLTHFLQDSLGGDCNTLMIVCVSPDAADASESLKSLNFATRVATVTRPQAQQHVGFSRKHSYLLISSSQTGDKHAHAE